MNEELKMLMGLMNGEIDPATALAGTTPEDGIPGVDDPPEIEITSEMKRNNPIVNKARNRNPISGVTDFLQNPEIQNALVAIGQSISNAGNYSGQPNPVDILGDTAREGITGQANQRALQAFEQGEDISAAAGRFADPELVANLQARRQQAEQFDEEMELEGKRLGLDEEMMRRNSIFKAAQFAQDKKLATAELENMRKQTEIDQQMADARQAYWEAIANREQGADNENLALRTNEYLQVLNEQDQVLDDTIGNTLTALENMEVNISEQQLRQLKNGIIDINDINIEDADVSNWPYPFDRRGDEAQSLARNLLSELGTQIKAQQTAKAQINALKSAQTERLTGKGEEEIEQERQEMLPGSRTNPLPVSTVQEMKNKQPGTFVKYGNVIYEIGPNNTKRRVGTE